MGYYCITHEGEFSGPGHDIPVVTEHAGPFTSLEEVLAMYPDSHETTGEEWAVYRAYWDAMYTTEGTDSDAGMPGGSTMHQTQNDGSLRQVRTS